MSKLNAFCKIETEKDKGGGGDGGGDGGGLVLN